MVYSTQNNVNKLELSAFENWTTQIICMFKYHLEGKCKYLWRREQNRGPEKKETLILYVHSTVYEFTIKIQIDSFGVVTLISSRMRLSLQHGYQVIIDRRTTIGVYRLCCVVPYPYKVLWIFGYNFIIQIVFLTVIVVWMFVHINIYIFFQRIQYFEAL